MSKEKDIKEVKNILKNRKKAVAPENTDDIINWTTDELTAYIKKEIKGKSVKNKLKFAKEINAKIKKAKEEYNNNSK